MSVFVMHLTVGALLSHASGAFGFRAFPTLDMAWAMGIGIAQLPYVVPAAVAAWFVRTGPPPGRRRGRPLALGIAIGAALTIVLNGTCFAAFALLSLAVAG